MKVVLHYRASDGFRAQLDAARPADMQLVIVDEADDAAFAREMADAHALLHVLRPVTAADIENARALRLIQKIGVGVNTIDLESAKKHNVAVCNMPGTNSQAVAEMTLMLMLSTLRRVSFFDPLTRAGNGWTPDLAQLDQVGEIACRTVGLIGVGEIPKRLVPVLAALGAKVLVTARNPRAVDGAEYVPLDDLIARADIISLHCPLTPETTGLISRERLAQMKRGSILVNTARGGLVDEAALIDALKSGHLAAAGLDVFAQEPTAKDNPLFALSNVVLMPHIAWLTPETLQRSLVIGFENCRRAMSGEPLLHRVV
ncbi:MAG TPA: 2-hydroxyacid dehydrogenase [Rhizomicrobium sp.]|nr:2-hydroxyacid dehydrogenase [Rhizomicrobium sp.]